MPVGTQRCVVLELHARVVAYVAVACHGVATLAVLGTRQTVVLSVIIISLATIDIFGTQLRLLMHKVVRTFTGAFSVDDLEGRVQTGEAKASWA